MTAHTPGPWKVVHDLRQYYPDSGEHELVGYDIESESGEQVIGCEGIEAWKDNAEANARLIAAAPELLAMLHELRECADYWSDYDVPIGIVARLDSVIAAAVEPNTRIQRPGTGPLE